MYRFVKAVLSAHDTVAQKNFDPVLPPLPEDLDDDLEEESVKIVRLVKNKEPLVSEGLAPGDMTKIRVLPSPQQLFLCPQSEAHLL